MEIDSFLSYLRYEKRYSSHTLVAYENDLTQFYAFCQRQYDIENVHDVDTQHVRSFIISLIDKDYKPKTINRKLSACKRYFSYALRRNWITHNPVQSIPSLKISNRLPDVIPPSDIEKLLHKDFCQTVDISEEDRILCLVLYSTGMRRSELQSLTHDNVTRDKIKVLGKGAKERWIPLPEFILKDWNEFVKKSKTEDSKFLFHKKENPLSDKQIYTIVHRVLRKISSVNQASPHMLRHAYATHLLDQGADVTAVKELLGHESLAATQVYTHTSIERLRKVYDETHPRERNS